MAAIGPTGGKLKQLFNPANLLKKKKAASMVAPAGGPKLQSPTAAGPGAYTPTFRKKLVTEKPKLMMARGAGKVLGAMKVPKQQKLLGGPQY